MRAIAEGVFRIDSEARSRRDSHVEVRNCCSGRNMYSEEIGVPGKMTAEDTSLVNSEPASTR